MEISKDEADNYMLSTRFIMKNKQPLFFAAVQIKKNYVSFHLMPVYVEPILLLDVSPELKKRMQGKSCFNFKTMDHELMTQLSSLIELGFRSYQRQGYVQPKPEIVLQ